MLAPCLASPWNSIGKANSKSIKLAMKMKNWIFPKSSRNTVFEYNVCIEIFFPLSGGNRTTVAKNPYSTRLE